MAHMTAGNEQIKIKYWYFNCHALILGFLYVSSDSVTLPWLTEKLPFPETAQVYTDKC